MEKSGVLYPSGKLSIQQKFALTYELQEALPLVPTTEAQKLYIRLSGIKVEVRQRFEGELWRISS